MKKASALFLAVLLAVALSCVSTRGPAQPSGVALLEAVEQSAEKIAGDLPQGSRVAIVSFESESVNLSDFIMEELTGALTDRGIEVADRQNLEFLQKELMFQMSGSVSDEEVVRVGQFLAANMVITGQLQNLGGTYRFRASAVHLEHAVRTSVTRLSVRNDAETQSMVASIASQKRERKTAGYGTGERKAPQTAGTFLDRGLMFLGREDHDLAIADFTEALTLNPNMAAAYFCRGLAYMSNGGPSNAVADFSQAIRLNPSDFKAYINRGNSHNHLRKQDKAIADYNQALQINPNSAEAYYNRGVAYSDKGDIDRAIADYNQTIRLNPQFAFAYYALGLAYDTKGDADKSIAGYTQAIRVEPDFTIAYFNRGIIYRDSGDYARALADFEAVLRIEPDHKQAGQVRATIEWLKRR